MRRIFVLFLCLNLYSPRAEASRYPLAYGAGALLLAAGGLLYALASAEPLGCPMRCDVERGCIGSQLQCCATAAHEGCVPSSPQEACSHYACLRQDGKWLTPESAHGQNHGLRQAGFALLGSGGALFVATALVHACTRAQQPAAESYGSLGGDGAP